MLGLKALAEIPLATLRTADEGTPADLIAAIIDDSERDLIYIVEIDAFQTGA